MRTRFWSMVLTAALLTGLFAGASPAPARAATHLELCGTVLVYLKPTALLPGAITIGAIPLVIVAGAHVDADVEAGANLCVDLTLNVSGKVTDIQASANVTTTVEICGTVQAYVKATATTAGSLRIGGRTFVIAPNADLPASVDVGADICIELKLNGFGQIKDGQVSANAEATVKICGTVQVYEQATLQSTGKLKIAGRTFTLGLGADLPQSLDVGDEVCLNLTLNGYGQVSKGSIKAGAETTLELCGEVKAYTEATATSYGLLRIAGHSFDTALNSNLPASVDAGADLCLRLRLNAFGQVQDGTATANVTTTLEVCGQVDAYVAATASNDGRIRIGAVDRTIAAGTDVAASVEVDAYVDLRLTIDAFGRVAKVTVLKVGATLAQACGGPAPTPAPTATPRPSATPTPAPTRTPGPTNTPDPDQTPTPEPTGTPNPTGTPGATATPSPTGSASPTDGPTPTGTPGPDGTPTPSESAAVVPPTPAPTEETCVTGVVAPGSGPGTGTTSDLTLPDTAAFGRAGGLLLVLSVPLLLLVAFGLGIAAWTWRRRYRELIAGSGTDADGATSLGAGLAVPSPVDGEA
jgi:hypothetical protein